MNKPTDDGEIWLPVEGFPNYEVSSLGQIWSEPRPGTKGGILKPYFNKRVGYFYITLTLDGVQHDFHVHRLVALAFLGSPGEGQTDTRHLDGNSRNNSAGNLAWGTRKENMDDQRRHGTNHESNKTHCPKKHPYDEENTRVSGGGRYCIKCQRQSNKDYYQRQKAKGIRATPLVADLTPDELARRREVGREAMRRHRAKNKKPPLVVTCATCGDEFTAKKSDAMFCSPRCKEAEYRRRRRAS